MFILVLVVWGECRSNLIHECKVVRGSHQLVQVLCKFCACGSFSQNVRWIFRSRYVDDLVQCTNVLLYL